MIRHGDPPTTRPNPHGTPDPDLRVIADALPDIVWVMEADGTGGFLNTIGASYTGISSAAVAVETLFDTIHRDDVGRVRAGWLASVRTGSGGTTECRIRRADGTYLWHVCRSMPVRDRAGAVTRWIGSAVVIEANKLIERDLSTARRSGEEALTLLAMLQDAAPVGFGFLSPDLRVIRINAELAAVTGSAATELVGCRFDEVAAELWGQVSGAFHHVVTTGASVRNVPAFGTVSSDGEAMHEWLVSLYPVRVAEEARGVGIVVVDVSEQTVAEALRAATMSYVAEGVCALDSDGRLTYMNRAASKMLGWSEDQLRGEDVAQVVDLRDAAGQPVVLDLHGAFSGPPPSQLGSQPVTFERKDGTRVAVSLYTVPLSGRMSDDSRALIFGDRGAPDVRASLIRVVIADADASTSHAFQALLNRREGVEVVFVASTADAAVSAAARLNPDVVLIADDVPGFDRTSTIASIRAGARGTSTILLIDGQDDAVTTTALAAGCAGVLDKARAWVDLLDAVRAAYRGEAAISQNELQRVISNVRQERTRGRAEDLTSRERDVLDYMEDGLSNRQIAERLGVKTNTVRNHVQRILDKLNVHSKLEAVARARRPPEG